MYCNDKMKSVLNQTEVTKVMQTVRDYIAKAQSILSTLTPEAQDAVKRVHEDNDGADNSLIRTLHGAQKQTTDILGFCMDLEGYRTTDQVQRDRIGMRG